MMGVERAVVRWYVQRQMILEEISMLETKVVEARKKQNSAAVSGDDAAEYREQLVQAQERLRLLGPCPRPMMG